MKKCTGSLNNYNEEDRSKAIEAIKNQDEELYKKIVGYDLLSYSDKLTCMVFYQDMIDTLNSISNVHSDKTIGPSKNDETKGILDFVNKVAIRQLR